MQKFVEKEIRNSRKSTTKAHQYLSEKAIMSAVSATSRDAR